jgi:hypothetical protein
MRWLLCSNEPVQRSAKQIPIPVRCIPLDGSEVRIASESDCTVAPRLCGNRFDGVIAIATFLFARCCSVRFSDHGMLIGNHSRTHLCAKHIHVSIRVEDSS